VGGKSKLAEQIIGIFPPHKKYIEPFFGGGWIFFKKQSAEASYINDINGDLTNLYEVVRDNPQALVNQVMLTPLSEVQFDKFKYAFNDRSVWNKLDPVKRALIYFYLVKVAFNSNPLNVFGVNPGLNWASEGLLETLWKVNKKLQNTVICNRDYKDLFKYADKHTLMYLDPPYAVTLEGDGSTYYENVLGLSEHDVLKAMLTDVRVKFKWVLSYDIDPLVEKLYSNEDGIYMFKTAAIFQSSINKHSRYVDSKTYDTAFKSEYLITNFPIIESLPLFNTQEEPDATQSSPELSGEAPTILGEVRPSGE
jgi:DNA adenine methylase